MANVFGAYDPITYAALALVQLEKALGMANRVYRGYDKEPQQKGSVINIRRPTYFVAQAMPISSANTSDLTPDTVPITLSNWYGTQFALTDKELSYTQEQIIAEHIRPAAISVADQIDQSLNALARQVPWYYLGTNTGTATGIADIPAVRRRLFDNSVSMQDIHLELSGEREQWFLSQDTFNRANDSGSAETQQRGTLGLKFGFEIFANQNVAAQQAGGTIAPKAAATLTLNAAVTVGATSIVVAASTLTGNLSVGDIVQVGHTATTGLTGIARTVARNFVVATACTATSNSITIPISPSAGVGETAASGALCVFTIGSTAVNDNLAFNRNAFALAMAPLPEAAKQMGAQIATVSDPITGLSLRVTMWYVGVDAKVYCRIDALWGVKTLNADMACRYAI